MGKRLLLKYLASKVDSAVLCAGMESASPMRQPLQAAGKLPPELLTLSKRGKSGDLTVTPAIRLDLLTWLLKMTFLQLRRLHMSTLTVRNIEPVIKDKLRLMAAAHGYSMAEEVRLILRRAVTQGPKPRGLGSRIHARFIAMGDVVLPLPERSAPPRLACFEQGRRRGVDQVLAAQRQS